jgi:hypothetical protein
VIVTRANPLAMCAITCAFVAGCGRVGFDVLADGASDTPDAPGPSGLVARYAFDDDPADGVTDSSGHGHTGTCLGPCPLVVTGRSAMAYQFDGVDDLVVVPYTADLGLAGGITVSAWIQTGAMTTRGCVASKKLGNGNIDSWALCIEVDLSVLFYSGPDTTPANDDFLFTVAGAVSTGAWQHVALSWDGTTKRIWVGGVEVAARDAPIDYDANDILLGGNIDSGSVIAVFAGPIDEIRLYDRALTGAEIGELAR